MNTIENLKQSEKNAIVEGLAMMTFIPSIGRKFEKGSIDKFIKIITKEVEQLEKISSQEEFDSFHDSIIKLERKEIKTEKGNALTYGQAQKPVNVFLKVYVDWGDKPSLEKSNQLRKFLHVPLDKILMREIKNNFPNEYKKYVVATYELIKNSLRKTSLYKEFGESGLHMLVNPSVFALSRIIYKEMYYAWQKCMRAIYPQKPILLDVLWSLKRKA